MFMVLKLAKFSECHGCLFDDAGGWRSGRDVTYQTVAGRRSAATAGSAETAGSRPGQAAGSRSDRLAAGGGNTAVRSCHTLLSSYPAADTENRKSTVNTRYLCLLTTGLFSHNFCK